MFDYRGTRVNAGKDNFGTALDVGRRSFLLKSTIGGLSAALMFKQNTFASSETPTAYDPQRSLVVERIELTKVVVPMRPGSVNSENFGRNTDERLLTFDSLPKYIIRAYTECGLLGLGETNHYHSSEPWFAQALTENIQFLTGRSILDLNLGQAGLGLPHPALVDSFEQIYYDLLGKSIGVPVHVLLGGRFQDKVAVTYWTGQRTLNDLPIIAQRAIHLGFRHLKFKARKGDPVVKQVESIRAVAPQLGLTVDFNHSYSNLSEFLPIASQLDDLNVMIEDPVSRTELAGLKGRIKNSIALNRVEH